MPGRTSGDKEWKPRARGGRGRDAGWRNPSRGRARQGAGDGGRGTWTRPEPHTEEETKTGGGWDQPGDPWIDTGTGWGTNQELNTAEAWQANDGWGQPPPKIETMEDLLKSQAQHAEDFMKDLVPFWLKATEAAERGEPGLRLEDYLEEKVRERKASGWYYSASDAAKEDKDGDGWSNHKASNGWGDWGVKGGGGWGEPEAQPASDPVSQQWEQNGTTAQQNGWGAVAGEPNRQNQWRTRTPRHRQHRVVK